MSVSTKVIVGYDGTAVKAGLASLHHQMGKIGEGLSERLGFKHLAGALGGYLSYEGLKQGWEMLKGTAEFLGSMNDLHEQTGESLRDLAALREAMLMMDVPAESASKSIAIFQQNLQKAFAGEGPERDAINKLGLMAFEIDPTKAVEMFKKVGERMASVAHGEREIIFKELFGGKGGYKMEGFFQHFHANWSEALMAAKELGDVLEENAESGEKMSRSMVHAGTQWEVAKVRIFENLDNVSGPNSIARAIDYIFNPDRIRNWIAEIQYAFNWIAESNPFEVMLTVVKRDFELFGEWMQEFLENHYEAARNLPVIKQMVSLFEWLDEFLHNKDSLQNLFEEPPKNSEPDIIRKIGDGIGDFFKNMWDDMKYMPSVASDLGPKIDQTNTTLSKILWEKGTPMFA